MPPPFSAASEQRIFAATASRNTRRRRTKWLLAMRVGRRGRGRQRRRGLAGEPCQIVLHRLEFRDLLLEGDALVGIAHADVEHQFQRARDLQAAHHAAHQHQRGLVKALRRRLDRDGLNIVEGHGVAVIAAEVEAGLDPAACWHRPARSRRRLASLAPAPRNVWRPWQRARRGRGRTSVPSALSVMRSFGLAGATVISPSGEEILACASSQPASMVSASGTAIAKRPAALSTPKPSARLAPEPPQSSGTHDSGRPALGQRLPERGFPPALLVAVDGLGIGEIGEDFFCGLGDNVLTLRHSVPRFGSGTRPAAVRPGLGCGLFLHRMMGKSHCHDKRMSAGPPAGPACRLHADELIPRNGVWRICRHLPRAIW